MGRVSIRVRGAWAELTGADPSELDACLSIPHPRPEGIKAYREQRWDGRVKLYKGSKFPAGLTQRVVEHFQGHGETVALSGWKPKPIDLSRLSNDYLPPVGKFRELWDHQVEAAKVLLQCGRGVLESPTGSGKTAVIAVIARYLWEEFSWRTLILVPKKGIMHQTFDALQGWYQDDVPVGMMGDGCRVEGDVIVATAQTMQGHKPRRRKIRGGKGKKQVLRADPEIRSVVRDFEVIIADECHRVSSDSWYELFISSKAKRRYGCSGTPLKQEELSDAKLIGATGPVVHSVDVDGLIGVRLAAQPKIVMVCSPNASGPNIDELVDRQLSAQPTRARGKESKYQLAYQGGVVENSALNHAIVRATQWLVDHGRRTLVLCRRVEHFERLHQLLEDSGLSFVAVMGSSDKSDRDHAKQALSKGRVSVALATTIWDEGEDIGGVGGLVLGEGVKSITTTLQRIGRGMRRDTDELWVVDPVPMCHKMLLEHAAVRADTYEDAGYPVQVLEEWPDQDDEAEEKNLLPFLSWQ